MISFLAPEVEAEVREVLNGIGAADVEGEPAWPIVGEIAVRFYVDSVVRSARRAMLHAQRQLETVVAVFPETEDEIRRMALDLK